jgi:hypothetical protein
MQKHEKYRGRLHLMKCDDVSALYAMAAKYLVPQASWGFTGPLNLNLLPSQNFHHRKEVQALATAFCDFNPQNRNSEKYRDFIDMLKHLANYDKAVARAGRGHGRNRVLLKKRIHILRKFWRKELLRKTCRSRGITYFVRAVRTHFHEKK